MGQPSASIEEFAQPSNRRRWDVHKESRHGNSRARVKKAVHPGKPTGQIQQRVQAVGPEHFGVVSVDCAKRRSKWMLCNFYGKVVIEPTTIDQHGGVNGGKCTWKGCNRQPLKDMKFCQHHAYPMLSNELDKEETP